MGGRFWDPDGARYGIPTYPFHLAPDGYATRRQLRTAGLRPGGQAVAGQLLWFSNRYRRAGSPPIRVAYLYRVDLAQPVRPMTPGRWRAHAAMMRARRTCPECRRDAGYVIPPTLGTCAPCAHSQDQRVA